MIEALGLSVAAFVALGLIGQLVRRAAPGTGPLAERPDFQYAAIGLGMAVVAAGGVYVLAAAEATTSYTAANRVLGILMLLVGIGSAGACLVTLLQRQRRQRG